MKTDDEFLNQLFELRKYLLLEKQLGQQIKRMNDKLLYIKKISDTLQDKLNMPDSDKGRLKHCSLTDSVLFVLSEIRSPLSPKELSIYIPAYGYVTTAKDLYPSVFSLCKRLVKQGVLVEKIHNGKLGYELSSKRVIK
ncbi:MAG TPA: hypothetical protein VHG89_11415 [Verrucomicrobiae bacterium]|nr:hypothetical protein [Verrucomicrobiae bacterium]